MENFDLNVYKLYEVQKPQVHAYQCPNCKKLFYPAPMICDKCNTRRDPSKVFFSEWDKVPLEGKCKLLTWTRVYALPEGYEVPFLNFGIVEFRNGLRASGLLNQEEPRTGMELEATIGIVRKEGDKKIYGLVFG